MADGRLPAVTPRPVQPVSGRDVKTAQRAFFEAALGKTQGAPAAQPTQAAQTARPAATAVQPHVTRVNSTEVPRAPEPGARYRPGSLLNIKI